jgi:hypothetical protein
MNKSRAEVVAELKDVGEPPGKELEYQLVSGGFEAVGCILTEQLPECPEAYLALFRLRESLFWARRAMGRAHVLEQAGLGDVERGGSQGTWGGDIEVTGVDSPGEPA